MSGFVDELLVSLDRSPGQLMPFTWLVLTVFQVACLSIEVIPNLALLSIMYNVMHKGPLTYFQVASHSYNFLYTKKVDKVEPSRWCKLWFLAKNCFSDEVRVHWSLSNTTLLAEDSAKTQTEVDLLRTGFPQALPHEVFCDKDVLIKATLTKGVDSSPGITVTKGGFNSGAFSSNPLPGVLLGS
ncbi:hypothetical protein LIER_42794 [Lithospermum erythrorhizon]|uniref:Uncharacterized protein n=1 Tax=Lithospermum erythrorhizon TaxID=34254 RepID=A0AAV3NYQ6_LITER